MALGPQRRVPRWRRGYAKRLRAEFNGLIHEENKQACEPNGLSSATMIPVRCRRVTVPLAVVLGILLGFLLARLLSSPSVCPQPFIDSFSPFSSPLYPYGAVDTFPPACTRNLASLYLCQQYTSGSVCWSS